MQLLEMMELATADFSKAFLNAMFLSENGKRLFLQSFGLN